MRSRVRARIRVRIKIFWVPMIAYLTVKVFLDVRSDGDLENMVTVK